MKPSTCKVASAGCGGASRSSRAALAILAVLAFGVASAAEKLGVVAVADPPAGPDPDLTELAHQLRAACRDRVGGVEDVSTMRARLLGQGSNATASELDRAYGGALAVYQNGEFESAARTLRAIVEDLEGLPEGDEVYYQLKRALLRLAHASATIGLDREADAAFGKLARIEPPLQPDPDQFSPSFRRRFEEVKAKIRALPKRRLVVVSEGKAGTVYVNGRAMGTSPLTVSLPAGTYRIGGAAGTLRVPSFTVDLEAEDRNVILDFPLAESLRVNAGPGLALAPAYRAYGIIRAGAWLGVDRLVVVTRVEEGQAHFLLGSMYDVRRGALLREGSVRMVAGSVPSVNLGALASFLLTGQSSREVKDRTQEGAREIVPLVAVASPDAPPPERTPPPMPRLPPEPPAPALAAAAVTSPVAARPIAPSRASATTVPAVAAAKGASPPTRSPAAVAAARPPAPSPFAPAPFAPAPVLTAAAPPAEAPLSLSRPALASRGEERTPSSRSWLRPAALAAGVVAVGLAALGVQQGVTAARAGSDADQMMAGTVLRPGSSPARYYALRSEARSARRNALVSVGAAAAFGSTAGVLAWISWDRAPAAGLAVRF